MLALKLLSQFRWSRHWAVSLSRWPCLLHPCSAVGRGRLPVTLFEKIRRRRPRWYGLSDLCHRRSGWGRCDQNMDWNGCKSAPLHADVQSQLSGSSAIQPLAASQKSWHRISILPSIIPLRCQNPRSRSGSHLCCHRSFILTLNLTHWTRCNVETIGSQGRNWINFNGFAPFLLFPSILE